MKVLARSIMSWGASCRPVCLSLTSLSCWVVVSLLLSVLRLDVLLLVELLPPFAVVAVVLLPEDVVLLVVDPLSLVL